MTRTHATRRGRRLLLLPLVMGIAVAFGCDTGSESGSSTSSPESDILVARSVDAGVTWSAPAALNVGAGVDLGADEAPQLTTDGLGTWLAVWHATSFADPLRTDFDVLVSHSADGGVTWTDQAELNSSASTDVETEGDLEPQLTTDGGGNWVAVWYSTAGYNRPQPPPPDDPLPPDNDILTARSTDDGVTWTAQVALNTNAATDDGADEAPQVTTDAQGVWVATWHSTDSLGDTIATDFDVLTARSADAGATWTAPAPLNSNAASDSGDDRAPQLTTDAQGTWLATWTSTDWLGRTIGRDGDILVARSTDDGVSWTAPVALNTNAADDDEDDLDPQLTTDGQGIWVAVWESEDSLADTIGIDADILVARSVDAGVTWTAPAPLNTNAASDAGEDRAPQLTTDAQGAWLATWTSTDALGGTIGTDHDILMARSTDGGATWSAPVPLNTNATGDLGEDEAPQLTTDGQGTWVSVWQLMGSL